MQIKIQILINRIKKYFLKSKIKELKDNDRTKSPTNLHKSLKPKNPLNKEK